MKLNKLTLYYEGLTKTIYFGNNTLIHSQKNSSGKSTLLRLVFYSMGYNIPQTKGLNFKKIKTELEVKNNLDISKIIRLGEFASILYNDGSTQEFFLPNDEKLILSQVWGNENNNVLNSILGSIYMDQEKGWTLLNRGTVIGSIKFKIEDLLEGVSNRDLSIQKTELDNINQEIKKYSQIMNIIEYKNYLLEDKDTLFPTNYDNDLDHQLKILNMNKKNQRRKISDLEESRKENKQFIDYIERMNLRVEDKQTGIQIPVTKNTIISFTENQSYIDARLLILKNDLSRLQTEITELHLEMQKTQNLFSIQSEVEKADNLIAQVNLPYEQLQKIIERLKKKKTMLNNEIKEKLSINNDILNKLHFNILKYAKRLNVDKYINTNKNYIFTSDLKSLSGAVLHKIVFAFKMSYIIELQSYLGYKLPIFLDSPSGRELDQKNVEEIFDILNEDFNENQIIVASIYKYKNFLPDNTIELIDRIFEEENRTNLN